MLYSGDSFYNVKLDIDFLAIFFSLQKFSGDVSFCINNKQ